MREKHCSGVKNKLKKIDYKKNEHGLNIHVHTSPLVISTANHSGAPWLHTHQDRVPNGPSVRITRCQLAMHQCNGRGHGAMEHRAATATEAKAAARGAALPAAHYCTALRSGFSPLSSLHV